MHCGVLSAAIFCERIIAMIFCRVNGWDMQVRDILWFNENICYVFKILIKTIFFNYGIRAIFYLPIAEYLGAAVINISMAVAYLKKKQYEKCFLWLMLGLSTIFFSIVQGEATPNRVIWQVFAVYVSFIIMLILDYIYKNMSKVKNCAIALSMLLIIWQISDLNTWQFVNYMRNKEENRVICMIGEDLERNYDIKNKPVVFVGKYKLSENILQYTHVKYNSSKYIFAQKVMNILPLNLEYQKQYLDDYGYQFNETGANSVITWGTKAFQEINTELLKHFRINGYVILQGTDDMYQRGCQRAQDMQVWPEEGSICEEKDYILVNFGQ